MPKVITKTYSAAVRGIDGYIIDVECYSEPGFLEFGIVGLPDTAVRESCSRISAAVKTAGFDFPDRRMTVNLAPADIPKQGTGYDLAIFVAVMQPGLMPTVDLSGKCFVGELAFGSEVRATNGVLSMCIAAKEAGFSEIYVPKANASEAAVVDGIKVYAVDSVSQLVLHLTGKEILKPHTVDKDKLFEISLENCPDFADVKGQDKVKKALEIAAAGMHNVFILWLTFPACANAVISRVSQVDTAA